MQFGLGLRKVILVVGEFHDIFTHCVARLFYLYSAEILFKKATDALIFPMNILKILIFLSHVLPPLS